MMAAEQPYARSGSDLQQQQMPSFSLNTVASNPKGHNQVHGFDKLDLSQSLPPLQTQLMGFQESTGVDYDFYQQHAMVHQLGLHPAGSQQLAPQQDPLSPSQLHHHQHNISNRSRAWKSSDYAPYANTHSYPGVSLASPNWSSVNASAASLGVAVPDFVPQLSYSIPTSVGFTMSSLSPAASEPASAHAPMLSSTFSHDPRERSPLSPHEISENAISKAVASAKALAAKELGTKPRRRRRTADQDSTPNSDPAGTGSATAKYVCETCGKSFNRPYNLNSHQKTHSADKPFPCQHCGKSFARSHDRKRHERLHDGSKKFRCSGILLDGTKWGCDRTFARADALGRHFRTESGWLCIKPLMNEAKENDIGEITQMLTTRQ
ncbi:unnamed protein product [Kuraishia capsulata CBS 1993]|uniref:C2H2-type domain-containing protein n=1 Tax=Kuraishia capsulata CBS 1993 TaxID=1382522 RepID=W6MLW7_9ASCO|nr:uncharacterized protein KUCA_T00003482001 [Kuraishia capsulata CBS 1993]CDK27504.1 unnamed protein product [Kuraishia capsulata CBS 1993]